MIREVLTGFKQSFSAWLILAPYFLNVTGDQDIILYSTRDVAGLKPHLLKEEIMMKPGL